MKLAVAVETLTRTIKPGAFVWTPDLPAAMQLGVEALTFFQEQRTAGYFDEDELLPGETKE